MTNDYENVTEEEVAESKDNAVNGITTFVAKLKACGVTITKQAKEIEELKKRIAELEKVESDSNNEHSECLKQIDELKEELEIEKNDCAHLNDVLGEASKEMEKQTNLNSELLKKNKELEDENKKLERQNMTYMLKESQYLGVIGQIKLLNNQEKTILDTVPTEG